MNPYDVIIIGAGAAGLSAARAARSAGRRVALVEAGRPGGDCTHYGCVPSKALLETARRIAGARDGAAYGFSAPVTVDFPAVMQRVRRVIADIEQDESPELLARQGIDLVAGWARFTSPHSVDVDGRRLTAGRFVLAIGAHAAIPPIPGLDQTPYLDNKSVFALTALPAHLLVLGGGAIGCELAQAFRRLGAQVTLVEAAPTLLVKEEPEAAAVLTAVLAREGVTVRTGAAVERVSRSPDGPLLHLSDGTTVSGPHLLVRGRPGAGDGRAVPGHRRCRARSAPCHRRRRLPADQRRPHLRDRGLRLGVAVHPRRRRAGPTGRPQRLPRPWPPGRPRRAARL